MENFQPTQKQERYSLADALRGLALFAIFIANIPIAENNPSFYSERELVLGSVNTDYWLTMFFHLFIDKKFVAIFSMLFGFGFYIQLNRAEAKGIMFRKYFFARMFLLFLIGCLHAYLLWFGEITRDYAIGGMLLLFAYRWPLKRILATGILIAVLLTGIIFILNSALGLQYGYDTSIVFQHPLATSYWQYLQINARIDPFVNFIQDSPITIVFAFGNMLIGFWMAKSGFFQQTKNYSSVLTRLMLAGLGLGLIASYVFWKITTGELEITLELIWLPIVIVGGLLLQSVAYIVAFMKLYQFQWFRKLSVPFELVGRMALTNYMLQSVFYLIVFFHCTGLLKLYGKLNLTESWSVAILLFALQVLFSKFWLARFQQGPVEYLWKRLAYRFAAKKADKSSLSMQKNELLNV